jgi:hypothetical protein
MIPVSWGMTVREGVIGTDVDFIFKGQYVTFEDESRSYILLFE